MRRMIYTALILMMLAGCAVGPKITMPQMDLPPEPTKPKIQSVVIPKGEQMYIGYSIADSLKLYEYLLQLKSDREKLVYRINSLNQILQER